jgi:hypothetical protein
MYSEKLHSATSSVTTQSTDRQGIWGKASGFSIAFVTTPNKAFANLPNKLGFPQAACIVCNRQWSVQGDMREIIGGADKMFLQRKMLIFQDLPTGYFLLEDVTDTGSQRPRG